MLDTEFVKTMRMDPRFPHQNQTKACYKNYCDFYKCNRLLGQGNEQCDVFKMMFETLCPKFWIEKFDDQREKGVFPGPI